MTDTSKPLMTAEGNKLIAEFLKLKKGDAWQVANGHADYYDDKLFQYHSSWDWLMPVVEKIEGLGYSTNLIQYQGDSMFILSEGTPQGDGGKYEKTIIDITETGFRKKEVTWQAVTHFIQWYNKTNQP